MTAVVTTVVLLVLLLLAKGFFSGSEIALVSADRVRLRSEAARKSAGARRALRLLSEPARLLTTTLLGTNLSTVALTTVGTFLMIDLFGGQGEWIALLVFTPLFLVLGEIVPKSVYQQKADTLVPIIAYPLGWLQTVLAPVVWLFSRIALAAARLIGGGTDPSTATRDQFLAEVQMAEKTGAIAAFGRGQVRRVLRYARMSAAEAMWPIAEVRCLDRGADTEALVALRRASGQRLVPLFDGGPNQITAVATIESWDLLDPDVLDRPLDSFVSPVRFVPSVQRMSEVIEMLTADPNATVIVVDELGSATGLITLNLLVRAALGVEASAVTDRRATFDAARLAPQADGGFLIEARTPITEVNEKLQVEISPLSQGTLGGYALARFGHIPARGESFVEQGYRFTVEDATERAIRTFGVQRERADQA